MRAYYTHLTSLITGPASCCEISLDKWGPNHLKSRTVFTNQEKQPLNNWMNCFIKYLFNTPNSFITTTLIEDQAHATETLTIHGFTRLVLAVKYRAMSLDSRQSVQEFVPQTSEPPAAWYAHNPLILWECQMGFPGGTGHQLWLDHHILFHRCTGQVFQWFPDQTIHSFGKLKSLLGHRHTGWNETRMQLRNIWSLVVACGTEFVWYHSRTLQMVCRDCQNCSTRIDTEDHMQKKGSQLMSGTLVATIQYPTPLSHHYLSAQAKHISTPRPNSRSKAKD